MCKIPASHYLASNSKKMTYGHELSLNLTHQNRAKPNKAEWRTHVDHELTFCILHFCPEHMFLQLISPGICDGAFSCVCFLCVGILGKKLFLQEKKQFLLLSGHGPNKDLNWTLNHELAAKPVLIYEVACTDSRGSWGRLCPDYFDFLSYIVLHLNQFAIIFSLCDLRKPFCSPKMQCNVTAATEFESCLGLKWGKDPSMDAVFGSWDLSHSATGSDHHLLLLIDCKRLIGCFQPEMTY